MQTHVSVCVCSLRGMDTARTQQWQEYNQYLLNEWILELQKFSSLLHREKEAHLHGVSLCARNRYPVIRARAALPAGALEQESDSISVCSGPAGWDGMCGETGGSGAHADAESLGSRADVTTWYQSFRL